jgi:hypothetical protein
MMGVAGILGALLLASWCNSRDILFEDGDAANTFRAFTLHNQKKLIQWLLLTVSGHRFSA